MEQVKAWGEIGAIGAIIVFASWMLKSILDRLKISDAMNDKMTVMLENHLTHIKDHMADSNVALKGILDQQKEICQKVDDLKDSGRGA